MLLGAAMYAVPLKAERVLYLDTTLPQASPVWMRAAFPVPLWSPGAVSLR